MREVLAQIHELIEEFEQDERTAATAQALHAMFIRLAAEDASSIAATLKARRFNLKCSDLQSILGGSDWGFQFKPTTGNHMVISHPLLPNKLLTVSCHFKGKQGQYNPSDLTELIRMAQEVEKLKAEQEQSQGQEELAKQQALNSPDGWKYFQQQERKKRFSGSPA